MLHSSVSNHGLGSQTAKFKQWLTASNAVNKVNQVWHKFYNSCSGRKASVRRAVRLTFHAGDAGASPRRACVLAAIHSLETRASAPDGGVRAAYVKLRWCRTRKSW